MTSRTAFLTNSQDPWDRYFYLEFTIKITMHVSKYTSPMDPMGFKCHFLSKVSITLPKFNSKFTPEKLPLDPVRKDRLPVPPFFRGNVIVKLRGCTYIEKVN